MKGPVWFYYASKLCLKYLTDIMALSLCSIMQKAGQFRPFAKIYSKLFKLPEEIGHAALFYYQFVVFCFQYLKRTPVFTIYT